MDLGSVNVRIQYNILLTARSIYAKGRLGHDNNILAQRNPRALLSIVTAVSLQNPNLRQQGNPYCSYVPLTGVSQVTIIRGFIIVDLRSFQPLIPEIPCTVRKKHSYDTAVQYCTRIDSTSVRSRL